MPDPKDKLEVKKYPRDVREVLEWCRARLMRPTEIKYGDEVEPRWDQGDNKEVIVLPIRPRGVGLTPLKAVKINNTHIRVVYGTVGGLSNPFSAGDSPIFSQTVSGNGVVYFNLTVADGVGTALAISSAASVPDDTDTHAYREICSFGTTAGVLSVAPTLTGSQAYQRCGSSHLFGVI